MDWRVPVLAGLALLPGCVGETSAPASAHGSTGSPDATPARARPLEGAVTNLSGAPTPTSIASRVPVAQRTMSACPRPFTFDPTRWWPAGPVGNDVDAQAADLDGDGRIDLVAAGPSGLLVFRHVATSDSPTEVYPLGEPMASGVSVRLGDVDGDGRTDVVLLDRSTHREVQFWRNQGSGQLALEQTLELPQHVAFSFTDDAVLVDLTGDGRLDLVVRTYEWGSASSLYTYSLRIFWADSTGHFQPNAITLIADFISDVDASAFAIADVNGDGALDVVGVSSDRNTKLAQLETYLGDGTGRFALSQSQSLGVQARWGGNIIANDLNRDGNVDVVFPTRSADGSATQLDVGLGNGAGGFAMHSVADPVPSYLLVPVELGGTGSLDFLASDPTGVSVWSVDPSGSLRAQPPITLTFGTSRVAVGDVDGDGIPDLLAINALEGLVHIGRGNGQGGFGPSLAVASPDLGPAASGDFMEDGRSELVAAAPEEDAKTLKVIVPGPDGAVTEVSSLSLGNVISVSAPLVADFDGDGHLDALLPLSETGSLEMVFQLFHGDGHGHFTFGPATPVDFSSNAFPDVVADLNGDHAPDLVSLDVDKLELFLNDGHGAFSGAFALPVGDTTTQQTLHSSFTYGNQFATAGDFNGDGAIDLAVSNRVDQGVWLLYGDGLGGFANPKLFAIPVSGLSSADLDGDGFADLIGLGDGLWVARGGAAGLTVAQQWSGTEMGQFLAVADIDGDGSLDVVGWSSPGSTVAASDVEVAFGDRHGGFLGSRRVPANHYAYPWVSPGRFDGANTSLALVSGGTLWMLSEPSCR